MLGKTPDIYVSYDTTLVDIQLIYFNLIEAMQIQLSCFWHESNSQNKISAKPEGSILNLYFLFKF